MVERGYLVTDSVFPVSFDPQESVVLPLKLGSLVRFTGESTINKDCIFAVVASWKDRNVDIFDFITIKQHLSESRHRIRLTKNMLDIEKFCLVTDDELVVLLLTNDYFRASYNIFQFTLKGLNLE